jgi:osmotically-inducible protein OsmY
VPGSRDLDDASIAQAALTALKWHVGVPDEKLKVGISGGWLTLDGDVASQFQRATAETAVASLAGVRGVTNRIVIKPEIKPVAVKEKIEQAFRRAAELDAEGVRVDVQGDTVRLRGRVRSWGERAAAERAAWSVAGVASVLDDVVVQSEAEVFI